MLLVPHLGNVVTHSVMLACVHRGVHFRTPNRTNLEKTPIFSGAPMETIQTFPKQLEDLSWLNSIYSRTSQMSSDLFNRCLWHHLHCQDAEHFFAEFSTGKTDHFFGGKISSTTRGSVRVENWHIFRWIFGPKSAGFCLLFRCGKPHFLHRCRWAHKPGPVISFCLELF